MGKIKTKLIKRTGDKLMDSEVEFSTEFERNKKLLGDEMPSKKIRNQIAGYVSRMKKREKKKKAKIARSLKEAQK